MVLLNRLMYRMDIDEEVGLAQGLSVQGQGAVLSHTPMVRREGLGPGLAFIQSQSVHDDGPCLESKATHAPVFLLRQERRP